MEKGNVFFVEGEKTEKEKEENIWRRKVFFSEEKKIGDGKGGNYLEKENIFLWRRRKRSKIFGEEKLLWTYGWGSKAL